jgi:hypothetical protein
MSQYDWFNTLAISAGDNLSTRVSAFVQELNIRDPYAPYSFSGTNDPQTILIEWNIIIDTMNLSPNIAFSNYPKYTYSVSIEAQVIYKNINNNEVTLSAALPFLEGAILLYKAINSEVEYVPQHGGDPLGFKQFSTAQATFKYRSFHFARLGFNSDLSTDFEYIDFTPSSYGIYGNDSYGTGFVWGGLGDKAPLRTFIPRKKQRSKFIGARIQHNGALESYQLYGITITYRTYEVEDRAYR